MINSFVSLSFFLLFDFLMLTYTFIIIIIIIIIIKINYLGKGGPAILDCISTVC